jgi:hypothetical protein
MGAHVFLSYTSADRALAERITKSLDDAGLTVTSPETLVRPGDSVPDALKKALTETDVMVAIVPPEGSPGSNNVSFEVGAAEGLNKPVLTVVTNPAAVGSSLRFQQISADLSDLVTRVRAVLNRPAGPP